MLNLQEAGFYQMTETQQLAYLENYEANKPAPNKLVEKVTVCPQTGRQIREFTGPKSVWMDPFKGEARLQIRIDKHAKNPYQMIPGGSKV